ncbi:MAG: AlpA family phage regulatory protein [Salinarimonas sp.]|nr:AlpA family phage regulatory protein [Salinarimonas sp.]
MTNPNNETDAVYLTAPQVRTRYGVSDMTLYRWLADTAKKFPKPIYIGRRRYWRITELVAWEEATARRKSPEQLRREAEAMLAHAQALEDEGRAA